MKEYRTRELYGDFYENEHKDKPLLVVIGGSVAGIPTISKALLEYFQANFHVLVLAYFGIGDLPEHLQRIPLEYFIHAVDYFKSKLGLGDDQVLMIGSSKGGELVLLLISQYIHPGIAIACVPSCYVWQGIPDGLKSILFPRSSWTFKGKDLPFVRFRYNRKIISGIRGQEYLPCYEKSIQCNQNQQALIHLDHFKGSLLLLSAETDHFWPSKAMCAFLKDNPGNKIKHITLNINGHHFLQYQESGKEMMGFLNVQNLN